MNIGDTRMKDSLMEIFDGTNWVVELLPCPFCNGEPVLHHVDYDSCMAWEILCLGCDLCVGYEVWCDDRDKLIKLWNTRA